MKFFKLLLSFLILSFYSVSAEAEGLITLFYYERAPYSVSDTHGNVSGLCATPAENAFKQAGIPFQWKKMPFKRQLMTIKYNKKNACGIGWFKNPERQEFAHFTGPIYQDRPAVTISKKGNQALMHHKDLASLFNDKSLKLLVKDGFSYGVYVDEQIKAHDPEIVTVAASTNLNMLQAIVARRADYFFISEEEAEHIIRSAGFEMLQFQLQHYRDIPAGNSRYIACSQQVPSENIDRLNQALKLAKRISNQ